MKKIVLLLIIGLLLIYCNKDDNSPYKQRSLGDGEFRNYTFTGILKDTTNNFQLIGNKVYQEFGPDGFVFADSISDSTYNFSIELWFPYDSAYFITTYNKIQVKNSFDSVLTTFGIPYSYWIKDGVAIYNYSF